MESNYYQKTIEQGGSRGSVTLDQLRTTLVEASLKGKENEGLTAEDGSADTALLELVDVANQYGLTLDEIKEAMPEVEEQLSVESNVIARHEHDEERKSTSLFSVVAKVKLRWAEMLETVGSGKIATRVKDYTQGRLDDKNYMQDVVRSALERRSMRKRYNQYMQLGGDDFQKIVEQFKRGVDENGESFSANDLVNNSDYQDGISLISGSLEIPDPYQIGVNPDGSPLEVPVTPEVADAIRRHMEFLLRDEVAQLAELSEMSNMASEHYRSDSVKLKVIAAKLLGSGTLWAFSTRTAAKVAIGGTVAATAFLATPIGAGVLVAAGAGAAAGVVSQWAQYKFARRGQRKIDLAVGANAPEMVNINETEQVEAVKSAESINQEVALRVAEVQRILKEVNTNPDALNDLPNTITNLYKTVADAEARLLQTRIGKGKNKQDYISFGLDNRLKSQIDLLKNLRDAAQNINEAKLHLDDRQILTLESEMQIIMADAQDVVTIIDNKLESILSRGETKRMIVGGALGGFFGGASSMAMGWFEGDNWFAGRIGDVSETPTFGGSSAEVSLTVDSDAYVISPTVNGDLLVKSALDSHVIDIPDDIDINNVVITDDFTLIDATTGRPLASIELNTFSPGVDYAELRTPILAPNLTTEAQHTVELGGIKYGLVLNNENQLVLTSVAEDGTLNLSDHLAPPQEVFSDSLKARLQEIATEKGVSEADGIVKAAGQFKVEVSGNEIVVKSIYNEEVVAKFIGEGGEIVAAPITPDAGIAGFTPADWTMATVHKGEGFSHAISRQLEAKAEQYGWDGTGDKHSWALRETVKVLREQSKVMVDGKEVSIWDPSTNEQLWVMAPDKYAVTLTGDPAHPTIQIYDATAHTQLNQSGLDAALDRMPARVGEVVSRATVQHPDMSFQQWAEEIRRPQQGGIPIENVIGQHTNVERFLNYQGIDHTFAPGSVDPIYRPGMSYEDWQSAYKEQFGIPKSEFSNRPAYWTEGYRSVKEAYESGLGGGHISTPPVVEPGTPGIPEVGEVNFSVGTDSGQVDLGDAYYSSDDEFFNPDLRGMTLEQQRIVSGLLGDLLVSSAIATGSQASETSLSAQLWKDTSHITETNKALRSGGLIPEYGTKTTGPEHPLTPDQEVEVLRVHEDLFDIWQSPEYNDLLDSFGDMRGDWRDKNWDTLTQRREADGKDSLRSLTIKMDSLITGTDVTLLDARLPNYFGPLIVTLRRKMGMFNGDLSNLGDELEKNILDRGNKNADRAKTGQAIFRKDVETYLKGTAFTEAEVQQMLDKNSNDFGELLAKLYTDLKTLGKAPTYLPRAEYDALAAKYQAMTGEYLAVRDLLDAKLVELRIPAPTPVTPPVTPPVTSPTGVPTPPTGAPVTPGTTAPVETAAEKAAREAREQAEAQQRLKEQAEAQAKAEHELRLRNRISAVDSVVANSFLPETSSGYFTEQLDTLEAILDAMESEGILDRQHLRRFRNTLKKRGSIDDAVVNAGLAASDGTPNSVRIQEVIARLKADPKADPFETPPTTGTPPTAPAGGTPAPTTPTGTPPAPATPAAPTGTPTPPTATPTPAPVAGTPDPAITAGQPAGPESARDKLGRARREVIDPTEKPIDELLTVRDRLKDMYFIESALQDPAELGNALTALKAWKEQVRAAQQGVDAIVIPDDLKDVDIRVGRDNIKVSEQPARLHKRVSDILEGLGRAADRWLVAQLKFTQEALDAELRNTDKYRAERMEAVNTGEWNARFDTLSSVFDTLKASPKVEKQFYQQSSDLFYRVNQARTRNRWEDRERSVATMFGNVSPELLDALSTHAKGLSPVQSEALADRIISLNASTEIPADTPANRRISAALEAMGLLNADDTVNEQVLNDRFIADIKAVSDIDLLERNSTLYQMGEVGPQGKKRKGNFYMGQEFSRAFERATNMEPMTEQVTYVQRLSDAIQEVDNRIKNKKLFRERALNTKLKAFGLVGPDSDAIEVDVTLLPAFIDKLKTGQPLFDNSVINKAKQKNIAPTPAPAAAEPPKTIPTPAPAAAEPPKTIPTPAPAAAEPPKTASAAAPTAAAPKTRKAKPASAVAETKVVHADQGGNSTFGDKFGDLLKQAVPGEAPAEAEAPTEVAPTEGSAPVTPEIDSAKVAELAARRVQVLDEFAAKYGSDAKRALSGRILDLDTASVDLLELVAMQYDQKLDDLPDSGASIQTKKARREAVGLASGSSIDLANLDATIAGLRS
ncbi:MAG: hypothetical protein Q8P90_03745 [bacterium]|nr:hypothetical protein [bacterium]